MTLTFLGAGSAFSRQYQTTCSLLCTPNKERWLVDCGRQAPEQLHRAGLSWHDVHGQLVTHAHGDHIFGLEELAFARYYATQGKVRSIAQGGVRPKLVIHQAVGREVWECLAPSLRYIERSGAAKDNGEIGDYFRLVPTKARASQRTPEGWDDWERFHVSEMEIHARIVPHVPLKPSTGFEVAWQGATRECRFWWSGDARVDASFLEDMAQRCEILFQDCSFAPKGGGVHGDFEALLALPLAVRRKMVLMHHDDDLPQHSETARLAGFRLAQPGHTYDLERGERCESASPLAA